MKNGRYGTLTYNFPHKSAVAHEISFTDALIILISIRPNVSLAFLVDLASQTLTRQAVTR